MTDRRTFVAGTLSLLAAPLVALATPVTAAAQPAGELPRIGLLLSFTPVSKITESPGGRALLEGLRALGWVDGQTVRIEARSLDDAGAGRPRDRVTRCTETGWSGSWKKLPSATEPR